MLKEDGLLTPAVKFFLLNSGFTVACREGHLEIAGFLWPWLGKNCPHDFDGVALVSEAFVESCRCGQKAVAMWLLTLGFPVPLKKIHKALRESCKWGEFETAKWVRTSVITEIPDGTKNKVFLEACTSGRWMIAQWVAMPCVSAVPQALRNRAFVCACENGFLDTAQWLVKGAVDLHWCDDLAFRAACKIEPEKDKTEAKSRVAKWMMAVDEHWPWPEEAVCLLKTWSKERGLWIAAAVAGITLPAARRQPRHMHRRGYK